MLFQETFLLDYVFKGFSQNFWWGDLLSETIFSVPVRDKSQMGGLTSGMESDEEEL